MNRLDAFPGAPVMIDDGVEHPTDPFNCRWGIMKRPKMDDNFWVVEHTDDTSKGDEQTYHVSKLCLVG